MRDKEEFMRSEEAVICALAGGPANVSNRVFNSEIVTIYNSLTQLEICKILEANASGRGLQFYIKELAEDEDKASIIDFLSHRRVLGVGIPIPEIALACSAGNVDCTSALVAATMPLPDADVLLVHPSTSAIGAAVILSLRNIGFVLSSAPGLLDRTQLIAREGHTLGIDDKTLNMRMRMDILKQWLLTGDSKTL